MFYIIDTLTLAQKLSARIKYECRRNKILDDIIDPKLNVVDLHETALRICWNAYNRDAKFPFEVWDDDNAIGTWFSGYTIEPVGFGDGNEPINDEPSQELYREVIDPFTADCIDYLKSLGFKRDWAWEEHVVKEVRFGALVMENKGDWRIRDWERIQRDKDSSGYQVPIY